MMYFITMAGHSAAGSSTAQTQSNHIQTNVIKTMILVSTFYAVAWLPSNVYYVFIILDQNLTYVNAFYYVAMFVAFLYTTTNPFIYATKFNPVRQILIRMIPWKKSSVQPTDDAETIRTRTVRVATCMQLTQT